MNEEKKLRLTVASSPHVASPIDTTNPVSYTHLDVYKRQHPDLQDRALGLTGKEQKEGNVCLPFGTAASWSPF